MANPYFQPHNKPSGPRQVAYVNPAYFQPSALHRHASVGVTKHGKAGVHARKGHTALGRRHGSPMPTIHDPFHGKAMGRNKR